MAADDIKGLNELGKLLDKLPERLQRTVIQSGVRAAADSLVGPLQAAAPVWSGRLEDSIKLRTEGAESRVARHRASVSDRLLVSAGIRLAKPGRYYWHFTEFGTVKRAANPWIRPTFARYHAKAYEVMKQYLAKRLEREARKLAKEFGIPR